MAELDTTSRVKWPSKTFPESGILNVVADVGDFLALFMLPDGMPILIPLLHVLSSTSVPNPTPTQKPPRPAHLDPYPNQYPILNYEVTLESLSPPVNLRRAFQYPTTRRTGT